jgi:hypothetical protein
LVPTNIVEPDLVQYTCKSGKVVTFGANMVHGFKSNERAKARSKTFEGVAKAMANQWAATPDAPVVSERRKWLDELLGDYTDGK